ncbi:MAG: hypothetical protein FWE91_09750 [Defluviitaleaceae bacterium]|nr:hypothetical protein [Defluviitaleaceae bacterium]
MACKPKKGRVYWFVTDFWERFYTIPVKTHKKGLQWHLGDGLYEYYYHYEPQYLYRKKKQAEAMAAKLNEGVKIY